MAINVDTTSKGRTPRVVVRGREKEVARRGRPVLTRAETAECTCPEFCERDHANE